MIEKRLAAFGFHRIENLPDDVGDLGEFAHSVQSVLADRFALFLFSPLPHLDRKFVYDLTIVGILNGPQFSTESITELAYKAHDEVRQARKRFRKIKIQFTSVRIYVLFPTLENRKTIEDLKIPFFKRTSRFPSINLSIIPIDCSKRTALGSRSIEPDREILLAVEQLSPITYTTRKSTYNRVLYEAFLAPLMKLYDFVRYFSLAASPSLLAYRISSGKIGGKDIATVFGLSTVISTAISQVFRIDSGGFDTGLSLIDSYLDNALIVIIFLLASFLNHLSLKILGGIASLKQSIVATFYIGAISNPIILMLVGVGVALGARPDEVWGSLSGSALFIGIPIYSALHQISLNRVMLAMFIVGPISLMLVLFAILYVFQIL